MVLCVISAFFWPASGRASWANASVLFAPVAQPARKVAAWVLGNLHSNKAIDPRKDADIRTENLELKTEIALLDGQLQAVGRLAAERRQLGTLLNYCVSVPVVGSDSDNREALNLAASEASAAGEPVVCPVGLVGRIQSAGPGGAKVLLITDKASRPISVSFGRMVKQSNGSFQLTRLATDRTLVYGHANNELTALQGLSGAEAKAAGLQAGDWAVLDDSEFPLPLAGLPVGQITSIHTSMSAPLYVDIVLRPARNLSELQEVLVVKEEVRR
jgi:cell shape-determining protein MreC